MNDARTHHMQMKYLLAQMAIQDPERFVSTFGPGGDSEYLVDLWTAVGQRLPEAERVSNAGIGTWVEGRDSEPAALVLILPAATCRNEAHFVGIVRGLAGEWRVFCLEAANPPTGETTATVLVEMAADGRNHWGPGGRPTVEEFVALMGRVVADPSARPWGSVPMRLG